MLIGEGSKFDWTAFAALTALAIWLVDGYRRLRERRAFRRLLAQIMSTPVADAQAKIAMLRSYVVPPGGEDTTLLLKLIGDQTARKELASKASLITLEIPSQFLDKADVFSEKVSNRLAMAFSQLSQLRNLSHFLAEISAPYNEEEIIQALKLVLTQIQETEQTIGEAYLALLNEGRASTMFRKDTSR